MAGRISVLRKLLNRWSRQQETALWQMTERKTAFERIAGFSKSDRVDAKFLLLALAPFVPVMISDGLDLSRGALWYGWFWLSVIWAVGIFAVGCASYWRAFRRSLERKP